MHSLNGLCRGIDRSRKLSLELRQSTAENNSGHELVPSSRKNMVTDVDAAPKPVNVLLVEDNPADVLLVEESLRECPVQTHLTVAVDGEIALRFLTDGMLRPDLVILDLNLPKINGFTVLEQYTLRTAPIVIFSSTRNVGEIQRCMARNMGDTSVPEHG